MSTTTTVHLVVPDGIGDPTRPSGGNTYDRRLCGELRAAGWTVDVTEIPDAGPSGRTGDDALRAGLQALPAGSLVLVDGLVASRRPSAVVPACRRLRLVVLLHMPVGVAADDIQSLEAECAVLRAASSVATPSAWCRDWLLAAYGLDPARVHVAHPGVDAAPVTTVRRGGGRLLCVGAVTPGKGHDVLLSALADVADLPWRCTVLGATSLAPRFVSGLQDRARLLGLDRRFVLGGPRTGADLDAAYAHADVLVHPSRAETYGMVVTEALARGLPVVATAVGGVAEALGSTGDGARPGLLAAVDDADALAAALRAWLSDPGCRRTLRAAALERRAGLTSWAQTAASVGRVLRGAA